MKQNFKNLKIGVSTIHILVTFMASRRNFKCQLENACILLLILPAVPCRGTQEGGTCIKKSVLFDEILVCTVKVCL